MPDADQDARELVPVFATTLEWMVETSVGTVGLELELVQEDAAPVAELRTCWTQRVQDAVVAVLARGTVGMRPMASGMLEHLVGRALEDTVTPSRADVEDLVHRVPAVWPASLVLRTLFQDELQVRVRATLCAQPDGSG